MSPRALLGHAKASLALAPVKPAVSAGLRTATATVVPLLAGEWLHWHGAVWATVSGFLAAFSDKGGAYRRRAEVLGAVTGACVVGGVLGSLAGNRPGLAVAAIAAWAVLCSLFRVWGAAGSSVGAAGIVTFVIAVALPSPLRPALERGGALLLGGLWAMALALLFWPVRLYRPARLAVAELFRRLATYATAGCLEPEVAVTLGSMAGAVRSAIEDARAVLVATRGGRRAEDPRGERLMILLETGDQLFARAVALRDSLGEPEPIGPAVREVLGDLAERCRALADSLEDDRAGTVAPLVERPRRTAWVRRSAQPAHLRSLLQELEVFLSGAEDVVRSATLPRELLASLSPAVSKAPAVSMREVFSLDSLVLRHALRVGLTITAGVAIAKVFHLPHGYWVTITIVVVMQPYVGPSWVRGLQRIGGTVLGGILAALLASWLHGGPVLMAILFVLATLSVAFMPINYGMYAVFLTPTFVLISEMTEADWSLAWVRVLNTIIGGALALVGTFLLWPSPERLRIRGRLSAALDALTRLFHVAAAIPVDPAALDQARRACGLDLLNAEESLQRLLMETPRSRVTLEPLMVVVTDARRLSSSALSLAALPRDADPEMDAVLQTTELFLRGMAAALREGTPAPEIPPVLHRLHAQGAQSALAARLSRIAGQLAILHQAVARFELERGERSAALPAAAGAGSPAHPRGG